MDGATANNNHPQRKKTNPLWDSNQSSSFPPKTYALPMSSVGKLVKRLWHWVKVIAFWPALTMSQGHKWNRDWWQKDILKVLIHSSNLSQATKLQEIKLQVARLLQCNLHAIHTHVKMAEVVLWYNVAIMLMRAHRNCRNRRKRVREWIRNWPRPGAYHQLIQELCLADSVSYRQFLKDGYCNVWWTTEYGWTTQCIKTPICDRQYLLQRDWLSLPISLPQVSTNCIITREKVSLKHNFS